MELELYAFVCCAKQLGPYLLGKLFTVRTDRMNLVYFSSSSIPELVRWRVIAFRSIVSSSSISLVTKISSLVNTIRFDDVDKSKRMRTSLSK